MAAYSEARFLFGPKALTKAIVAGVWVKPDLTVVPP
ncbi:MAG: hypothetical protein JWM76_2870 [Pseudonocardiales bacterium]|nr:hypothetical protein [Pseudonocardiales bacterium]